MNDRRIRHADRMVIITLIITVTGLAVWGAGVFPGALHLAAVILIIMAGIVFSINRNDAGPKGAPPHLEVAFGLVLILLVLSILPIPPQLERVGGHSRHSDFENTRSMLTTAATQHLLFDSSEIPGCFSFSYNRAGSIRAILLFGGMAAAFILATRLPNRHRLGILVWIIILGASMATAGYLGKYIWPQGYRLWWLFPADPNPVPPVGGFMNRNHFGGVLAFLVPSALGVTINAFLTRRWIMAIPAGMMSILSLLGIVMCQSRGAMVAVGAGILATITLIILRPFSPSRLLLFFFVIIVAAVAFFALLPHDFLLRFQALRTPWSDPALAMRLNSWRDTLNVFMAFPLFGVGANALGMVYPQFRVSSHGGVTRFCDNEYLQMLAEFGLIGIALCLVLLFLLIRRIRHSNEADQLPWAMRAGIYGAMVVCATHSMFDMPLRLPLYGYLFAILLGLVCAPSRASSTKQTATLFAAFAAILITITATAHRYRDVHELDYPNSISTAGASALARTLAWAPTSSGGWFNLGRLSCNASPDFSDPRYHFGELCMSTAAIYDPQSARIWHQLGYVRMNLKDYSGARQAFTRAQRLRPWLSVPQFPPEGKTE